MGKNVPGKVLMCINDQHGILKERPA